MDPDKQKQIMGYFIEEAADHLNTIETGLINLQETLADQEMLNEIFRAAHSIKGGAAMLGIGSMQHVAHNLEDYFKVLKENPHTKVDQQVQSLFLKGFDTLKELLIQLQSPTGLTDDVTKEVLAESEPIFTQLKNHIQAITTTPVAAIASSTPSLSKASGETRAMAIVFQSDVPAKLRDMLQLFKQPDRPTSRKNLQTICDQLYQMGEQFDLEEWCEMIQVVKLVANNANNSYRNLAPVIIKEIKQAQELVLAQRGRSIAISPTLKALMPLPDTVSEDDEISGIFGEVIAENLVNAHWQTFVDRLQWRVNGKLVAAANNSSAPEGHFPTPIWLSGWEQPNSNELRLQIDALMSRIEDCK
jgi:chemotaxis protein histidine kinase CheA